MSFKKHLFALASVIGFVVGGCIAEPLEEEEPEGEVTEALAARCAPANAVGPCASQPIAAAVRCATNLGAQVLSFYRSPAEQECVRRQNGCRDRCSGSAGCRLVTASCGGSPHTRCGSVDLVADGAPLTRAQLASCGLAKTTAPHRNHYDYVGGGTTTTPRPGSDPSPSPNPKENPSSPSSPSGTSCASATLGRNVSPGTCVRRSDGTWYVCDASDPTEWPSIYDSTDARCTSCPQLSSGPCGGGSGTGGKGGSGGDDSGGGGKGGGK